MHLISYPELTNMVSIKMSLHDQRAALYHKQITTTGRALKYHNLIKPEHFWQKPEIFRAVFRLIRAVRIFNEKL